MTYRLFGNVFFLVSILFLIAGAVPSQAGKDTKRILVLYSQEKGHPAHDLTEKGIRAAFLSNSSFDVQFYTEYLDVGRFQGPSHAAIVADYLRRKYSGVKIDVIISVYPSAADFLLAERSTLFPDVPIVAAEVSRSYAENLEYSPARRFITGTIVGDNITGIMNAALRMRPGIKHVALVAGTSPNDIYVEQVFRRGFMPYMDKLELIELAKLSMEETLSRVSSLPEDTIILYCSIVRDGAGKSFVPREALSLIARTANAPVFGIFDSYMGYGIVGGRLVSLEQNGREATALALRIMGGESPAAIPFSGDQAYVNLYDWREIKRWGIPEAAVPSGGRVLYRQPSLWEDHWIGIVGVLILISSEGILIVGLIINLSKRNKAERFLRESKQDIERLAVRLVQTQEEELRRLSRELHDDLTQRLAGLAIDAGILEKQLMALEDPISAELRNMKIKLIDVSEDVHNISRQLHSSILDDIGLAEAIKSESAIFSKRTGIALSFETQNMPNSIPKDIALCLYRVIQESLRNIEKHAKTTEAQISLKGLVGGFSLSIQDHGIGFDNEEVREKAGLGLSSIRERVRLINGTMSIKAEPGKGTRIDIVIPLGEENDKAACTNS